jgi:hypothetical protein
VAKPASLPRWGETVGGVPDGNITEPNEGKKDTGWVVGGDIPTSGGLNWWMRLVYLWVKWVDTAASIATESVLVVRDEAGRARFADPSDAADAATKGWVEAYAPPQPLAIAAGANCVVTSQSVAKTSAGIVTISAEIAASPGATSTIGQIGVGSVPAATRRVAGVDVTAGTVVPIAIQSDRNVVVLAGFVNTHAYAFSASYVAVS